MRSQFSLFNTPIDLAHHFWGRLLQKDDVVMDATCGNGKDSLILANMLLLQGGGKLHCFDLQETSIIHTRELIAKEAASFLPCVAFHQQSHEAFPPSIEKGSVTLIVYNLGYLPGGDKMITTRSDTTLTSIQAATELLLPGGVLSVTCYPGHPEGKKEYELLIKHLTDWHPKDWSISSIQWLNRSCSPILLLLQKTIHIDNNVKNS